MPTSTRGLLLVIHGCVRTGRDHLLPVAVGIWIGGAYWSTSSTSFANPAVTVARTLSDSFAGIAPASVPMFVLMQAIGALIAYGLIRAADVVVTMGCGNACPLVPGTRYEDWVLADPAGQGRRRVSERRALAGAEPGRISVSSTRRIGVGITYAVSDPACGASGP